MMKRVHPSDYRPVEGTPLEQEVALLRDENRRLKGLLELREDRSALETFQVQSRNRLLALFGLVIVLVIVTVGVSTFYLIGTRTISEQKIEITRLRHGILQRDALSQ